MAITIPRKPFNLEAARDMREHGKSLKYVAEHFSMSVETVRKRLIEAGDDTSHANFSWQERRPANTNLTPMEVLATLAIFAYGKTAKEAGEWLDMPKSTVGETARRGARKLRARGLQDA